jgi:hypothetical protein
MQMDCGTWGVYLTGKGSETGGWACHVARDTLVNYLGFFLFFFFGRDLGFLIGQKESDLLAAEYEANSWMSR